MATTIDYIVEYSPELGAGLIPRVARVTYADGVEVGKFYPAFEEISVAAPSVAVEFISAFKTFMSSAVDAITPEDGFDALDWEKVSSIEAAVVYVAVRTPLGPR